MPDLSTRSLVRIEMSPEVISDEDAIERFTTYATSVVCIYSLYITIAHEQPGVSVVQRRVHDSTLASFDMFAAHEMP